MVEPPVEPIGDSSVNEDVLLINPEFPFFKLTGSITEEEHERQWAYLENFRRSIDIIDFYGHAKYTLFEEPGSVVSRHHLNCALICAIEKRMIKLDSVDVTNYIIEAQCFKFAYFEQLKMPSYDFNGELDKIFEKYPLTKKSDLRKYLMKIVMHLPEGWKWIYDWNQRIPPLYRLATPAIRAINMGEPYGVVVFVEDVRRLVFDLQTKSVIDAKMPKNIRKVNKTGSIEYFPVEYLEYALGLFGIATSEVKVVEMDLGFSTKDIHHPCMGTSFGNYIPAVSAFLRHAEEYQKASTEKRRNNLIHLYRQYYTAPHLLAYFVPYVYFLIGHKKCSWENGKEADELNKKLEECNAEPLKPRTHLRIPMRAMLKLPKHVSSGAVQMMRIDGTFAHVLHVNGFCEPEVCFAKIFESPLPYGPCVLNEQQMRERIVCHMKKEPMSQSSYSSFMKSHGSDFTQPVNTAPVSENDVKTPIGKKTQLESLEAIVEDEAGSSQMSPCSSSCSEPSFGEKLVEKETSSMKQFEQIKCLLSELEATKLLASEHEAKSKRLNKRLDLETQKNEEKNKLVESLKQENAELKNQIEKMREIAKNDQDKLKNDLKKLMTERDALEDDLIRAKTKKNMEDTAPLIAQLKKKVETLTRSHDEASKSLESLTSDFSSVRSALMTSRSEVSALQNENRELLNDLLVEKHQKKKLEERQASIESSTLLRAVHHLQAQTNAAFAKIDQSQKSSSAEKERLEELEFLNDLYEKHSSPSVRAAVKRLQQLQKLLDESLRQEERFGKSADNIMMSYIGLESKKHQWRCKKADIHLKKARAARFAYEAQVNEMIESIKNAPHLYFTLYSTHVDPPFPKPFLEETLRRIAQLQERNKSVTTVAEEMNPH